MNNALITPLFFHNYCNYRQPDEIKKRLKLGKKSITSKLDKFNSRKKHNKKNVSKNKVAANRLMPEDLVNKNVDHIFDVTDDDGQVTQIAYSGFITRIVKKHKDPKQTLFEIVYDSVYNNESDDDEQEPDEEDTYEYALLQDYYEGNLLTLN